AGARGRRAATCRGGGAAGAGTGGRGRRCTRSSASPTRRGRSCAGGLSRRPCAHGSRGARRARRLWWDGSMPSLGRVRLVATDLDGTVVRRDGTVSPRMVAALRAVEDAGVPVVLVTGRPPRWMYPVVEATGHRGTAVCANGALVYDLATERVVDRDLLEPEAPREVVRGLRAALPRAVFAVERHESYAHERAYRMR